MSSLSPEPAGPAPPTFREARDLLLELDDRYVAAKTTFVWPRPERFNWALEWFDAELAAGEHGARTALKVIGETVETRTFAELSDESARLANGLRAIGAKRGDRILMALAATPELWVTMLAAMKLGLVLIPAMPHLRKSDIADRLERGKAKFLVAHGRDAEKFAELGERVECIAVGEAPAGWRSYASLISPNPRFVADGPTLGRRCDAGRFRYLRAAETRRAQPRQLHDRASVDHVRARPQARRHAPRDFLAGPGAARLSRIRALERWLDRDRARRPLRAARRARRARRSSGHHVLRAPVRLAHADPRKLGQWKVVLREFVSSGEPLDPALIEQVRRAWGLTIRDSYGQTETTMMIGNSPGQKVIEGSMGRALPGYRVALLDADGLEGDQGEIALPLRPRPVGLMRGYQNEPEAWRRSRVIITAPATSPRAPDGFITYVGRLATG